MKIHRFLISLVIFTILVFTLLVIESCKKDNDDNNVPTPPVYTNGEGEIGPIGGTVTIEDPSSPLNGVSVNIPQGALTTVENIKISLAPENIRIEEDSSLRFIKFEPEGLVFNKPVVIGIPYDQSSDTAEVAVIHYDPDSLIIEELCTRSFDVSTNIIYAETDHFSYYTRWKKNISTAFEMLNINGHIGARLIIGSRSDNDQPLGLRGIPTTFAYNLAHLLEPNVWSAIIDDDYYGNSWKKKIRITITLVEKGVPNMFRKWYTIDLIRGYENIGSNYYYKAFVTNANTGTTYYISEILPQEEWGLYEKWFSLEPLIFHFEEDASFQINPSKKYYIFVNWQFQSEEMPFAGMSKQFIFSNSKKAKKFADMIISNDDNDNNYVDDYWQEPTNNTPPEAVFSVNPSSGTTSTIFNFNATYCSDNEDPLSALEVIWDWEDDGTWDTDWSTVKTEPHQYSQAGSYNVKLRVRDTGGMTDDASVQVSVTQGNQAPTEPVLIFPPNNSSQDVTVIVLQWNCDDPENDPMVYDIYFGNNNPPPLYESDHPDKSLVVDDLIAGETYWWKIVAKDDHDNSSTGPTWTFDVTGGTGIPIEPHNVFAGLLARGERNRYLLE